MKNSKCKIKKEAMDHATLQFNFAFLILNF